MAKSKKLRPIPPGEILLAEFLEPLSLSQNKLAIALGVSPPRVNALVRGKYRITPELALRLGRFFRTGPELWMNMQKDFDLEVAQDELSEEIERTVRPISNELLDGAPA